MVSRNLTSSLLRDSLVSPSSGNSTLPVINGISYQSEPYGDTYRGLGSSIFNAGNVADENFMREMQAQNNALYRDLMSIDFQNQFNAKQAEIQREFEREMASTQYQRMVEDLKKAGLNPILAYSNGGADVPQGSSAQSGSSSRSGSAGSGTFSSRDTDEKVLGAVLMFLSGMITHFTAGKMPVRSSTNTNLNYNFRS